MAWTKSGTVNLTNGSAVVYGAGTAWVSGGMARPGDVFIAPGGGLYEVASVQSNTQLTLSSAYLGVTASAQAYSLVHTGLLPSELAINLSSLQSKYLTTISQLWEWETSNAATVPLTNPATGVTTNVKPIAGLVLDVGGKAPIASPSFTGTLTHSGGVVLSGSVRVTSPAGLGYGPGAGGTVTQATSKSTAVTLNKPCGLITMHNEALAGGASVMFTVNNSLVKHSDLICLSGYWGAAFAGHYRNELANVYDGGFSVRVTNLLGVSLSDEHQFNFAIIKGATY